MTRAPDATGRSYHDRVWKTARLVMALGASVPPGIARTQSPSHTDTLTLHSAVFHNTRLLRIWVPPGYDDPDTQSRRYPVVYFTDGVETQHGRHLDYIARRLTEQGTIPPAIFVMIDNGASTQESHSPARDRADEYLPYPDSPDGWNPPLPDPRGKLFPDFLEKEVRPLVEFRFRVRTDAPHVGLAGASYGGAIAVYTAMVRPRHYGLLLLESPSLHISDRTLLHAADSTRVWPDRVYIGVGTNEGSTADARDEMVANAKTLADLITSHSPHTRTCYWVVPGAEHGDPAWRARLPAALTFLLGDGECPKTPPGS
jgi:enterochelin esterase-like enzyme